MNKHKKMRLNYLSVNVYDNTNRGHYLFVFYWGRDRHFTWSSEPLEGQVACSAMGVPLFLSYFKTLSNGTAPGIELATITQHSIMFSFCMGIFISNEWKHAQGHSSKLIKTAKYIFMSDIFWGKKALTWLPKML